MRAKILVALLGLTPLASFAATLDGSHMSAAWGLPFLGLLLSLAICPLVAPHFWHRHYGKLIAAWSLAFLLPCAFSFGADTALSGLAHTFIAEYFPFMMMTTALFVVPGGICLRGNLHGTPGLNTGMLALGTVLASIMGTTGAAMLMIRPLIRANDHRKHTAHVIVFFIFLVANAGGSLTPLGNPPLFLGFLKGIDFFWTIKHIFPETLLLCLSLLAVFYVVDRYYFHRREEELPPQMDPTPDSALRLEGKVNFLLLAVVIGLVLMSGLWRPGVAFSLFGTGVEWQNLLRDILLLVVVVVSLKVTPKLARNGNDFAWGPVGEVGIIFAGIFITIIPVMVMLSAGLSGSFASVIHAVTDSAGQPINLMYFWASGLLSSFLDNAPTYLVFFNTAGGDPKILMSTMAATLAALSCGSSFMGAMSYIGNAPNMMVKSIAVERGIKMPSFFGYMAWSVAVLVPIFMLMSLVFFRS